ncbi:MAG: hypothetical protein ACI9OU_002813 [Candidatus Promineifilaceae bacterium]|jgi:hypothetical protein
MLRVQQISELGRLGRRSGTESRPRLAQLLPQLPQERVYESGRSHARIEQDPYARRLRFRFAILPLLGRSSLIRYGFQNSLRGLTLQRSELQILEHNGHRRARVQL